MQLRGVKTYGLPTTGQRILGWTGVICETLAIALFG